MGYPGGHGVPTWALDTQVRMGYLGGNGISRCEQATQVWTGYPGGNGLFRWEWATQDPGGNGLPRWEWATQVKMGYLGMNGVLRQDGSCPPWCATLSSLCRMKWRVNVSSVPYFRALVEWFTIISTAHLEQPNRDLYLLMGSSYTEEWQSNL